jgi:5'-nucleotidase
MSFLIDEKETGHNWKSYFDYIVVEANKPQFFDEGTTLKEINIVDFYLFSH